MPNNLDDLKEVESYRGSPLLLFYFCYFPAEFASTVILSMGMIKIIMIYIYMGGALFNKLSFALYGCSRIIAIVLFHGNVADILTVNDIANKTSYNVPEVLVNDMIKLNDSPINIEKTDNILSKTQRR